MVLLNFTDNVNSPGSDEIIVRHPRSLGFVSIAIALLALNVTGFSLFFLPTGSELALVTAIVIFFVAVAGAIETFLKYTRFTKTGITHRSLFGQMRKYNYSEINFIGIQGSLMTIVFLDKSDISFNSMWVDTAALVQFITDHSPNKITIQRI